MERLPKRLNDTVNSVMQEVQKQSTLKDGLKNEGGKTTPPITKEEAKAIAQAKLWNSPAPTEREALSQYKEVLYQSLSPITREDAIYWVGRLIQHFPNRQTEKDAIVISDIADDIVHYKCSHVAVIRGCDELRRASSKDNPYIPPTGEIIKTIRFHESFFKERKYDIEPTQVEIRETAPIPAPRNNPKVAWANKTYEQCKKENLIHLVIDHVLTISNKPVGTLGIFMTKREEYIKFLHEFCGFPQRMEDWA